MTIKQIQNLLQYLGYYDKDTRGRPLIPDGCFGPGTRSAVAHFQHDYGLSTDGDPGAMTQKALVDAVAHGMPIIDDQGEGSAQPSKPNISHGVNWDKFPHFTAAECQCKCHGQYCKGWPADPAEKLLQCLEDVREASGGKPVSIISFLRCPTWNRIQKGVPTSLHQEGLAVDFRIKGYSAAQTIALVDQISHGRIKYRYAINGTNVHMDLGRYGR